MNQKERIDFYKKNYKNLTYGEMAPFMGFKNGESCRDWAKKYKMPNRVYNLQAKRDVEGKEKLIHEINFWQQKAGIEKRKRFDEEKIVETLVQVLSVVKPVEVLKTPKIEKKHSEQEVVLMFGDSHIGKKILKSETGFYDYNIKIFEKELNVLYNSIINITERHRKDHPIRTLNIFMLGDIIEGFDIFKGQVNRIDIDVVEQVFEGQRLIAGFIQSLAKHFDNINVPCVVGNHGRVGQKDYNLSHVNWDYIIYKNLEQILSPQKNIKFDIGKEWYKIVSIQGWKFYIEHGDRIKSYMNVPWYSVERIDNRISKMLGLKNESYQYFLIGHHHVPFEWDVNNGERICNGTFSAGDPYAMKELRVLSRPTQKFFGVHKQKGITWRYNIRLD